MHYLNYEENRIHGSDAFPLEYYAVDARHPRYTMPHHWHSEAELLYIRRGSFCLSLEGTEKLLQPGELCYIPGGALHGGEPRNCDYECIDFNPAALLGQTHAARHCLKQIENQDTQIWNVFGREQPEILQCVQRLFAAARQKEDGWEMLVLAGLHCFYGTVAEKRYYSHVIKTPGQKGRTDLMKLAVEYITANYREPITLADLARVTGLSSKYFCRYFRAATGKTLIDYVNFYRVDRACFLLEQNIYTVTEVAAQCGFNDLSYFIRCFRKYKDCTPYSYLRQYAQKQMPQAGHGSGKM